MTSDLHVTARLASVVESPGSHLAVSKWTVCICLDKHMPCDVYQKGGICLRDHCRAEPPGDTEPAGFVRTVGWRDRAAPWDAAADRVKAPARAARRRFRGIHGGRTASSLPAETGTTSGGGCLAGAVPSVLVGSPGCSRTPPRPHGEVITNEKEGKEEKVTASRAVRAGSGEPGARTKGRREVDARSRQTAAPLAGKSLAGAHDPVQLREWAPFDADGSLDTAGSTVKLTTVGAPTPHVSETTVTRADTARTLEYNWGGSEMRWELEASGSGTRLTLWTNIDRRYISMGAAGWHICFDVLDHLLSGAPIGRIVGPEVMKFDGWQRLNAEYAKQFGVVQGRSN